MRSSRHHFDLIVIGSGPGGQRAATQAAKLRKRVAICERRRDVGGVSINSGTVPSKTLREAVIDLSGLRHRDLVLAMSTKLEALIKREIGLDDGREMPPLAGVNWTIDVKGNQAILD